MDSINYLFSSSQPLSVSTHLLNTHGMYANHTNFNQIDHIHTVSNRLSMFISKCDREITVDQGRRRR